MELVFGEGDDIGSVEEDPEDFFCDVDDLFGPTLVRAASVNPLDEFVRSGTLAGGFVAEVGQEAVGTCGTVVHCSGGEVCEEDIKDEDSCAIFGGAFAVLIKDHVEKAWEEGIFNFEEFLEGEVGGAERLEAEEKFVEDEVLVLFTPFNVKTSV